MGSRLKEWGGVVRVEEADGAAIVPPVQLFAEVEASSPSKARRALSSLVKKAMKCATRPVVLGISLLHEGAFVDQTILAYDMDGWVDKDGSIVDMDGSEIAAPADTEPELPFVGGLPALPAPRSTSYYIKKPDLIFPFPDEVIAKVGNNVHTYDKGR